MSRKKIKKIYKYECTMSGETFKTTAEAKHPDELVSVKAYYELHPDKDDRPQDVKIRIKQDDEALASLAALGTPTQN
ncbi:MAG: hypothetical protein L6Q33_13020 [Bacteriovoracaceae bacterium]|jgi:cytidylate kinase|nr:hypothetical protein [Bacteriovoracaceae bacterium]